MQLRKFKSNFHFEKNLEKRNNKTRINKNKDEKK